MRRVPVSPPLAAAQIWNLLLVRLQSARSRSFARNFSVFLSLTMAKHGVPFVAESLEAVQARLYEGASAGSARAHAACPPKKRKRPKPYVNPTRRWEPNPKVGTQPEDGNQPEGGNPTRRWEPNPKV